MPNTFRHSMDVLCRRIWKHRAVYTLLIPGLIWYIVFAYGPMGGLVLAFKTYRAKLGILGSPWAGMENFQYVFRDPDFVKSVWRTLYINIGRIVFTFPVPVLLALLLNELKLVRTKKAFQTILTFPYFLSWVVVASVLINLLTFDGLANKLLNAMGLETFNFLGNAKIFLPLMYITDAWKTAGWNAIIYLAAITGIDVAQYEAAKIDGASRLQEIFYITLPNILPTIVVLFILAMGNVMSAGFEQIFNFTNPAVRSISETLDMYIYRITFQSAPDFSFSTAVSLFRSIVNMLLLLLADRGAKAMGGGGLLG